MSITPNLCCDKKRNQGAYTRLILPKNNLLALKEEVPLGYPEAPVRTVGNWGGGGPPDQLLPSALLDLLTLEAVHWRPDAHDPW